MRQKDHRQIVITRRCWPS